jgi:hypothetical protein
MNKQQKPVPSPKPFLSLLESTHKDLKARQSSAKDALQKQVLAIQMQAVAQQMVAVRKRMQSAKAPLKNRPAARPVLPPMVPALRRARRELAQRLKATAQPQEKRVLIVQMRALQQRLSQLVPAGGAKAG